MVVAATVGVAAPAGAQVEKAAADADLILSAPSPVSGDRLGHAVAGGSVVANPGADVLVGAPFRGNLLEGAVFLFDGVTGVLLRTFSGQPGANQGWAVSFLPDLNGNQVDEALMGAPNTLGTTGAVFADDAATGTRVFRADSTKPLAGDWFGATVTAGQFLNGGVADVLVGAPEAIGSGGEVHRYEGSDTNGQNPVMIQHFLAEARFGRSIAVLGDVFGNDGADDFVIGAPRTVPFFAGVVQIHSAANTTGPLFIGAPLAQLPGFGTAVARVSDQDGSGIVDIAVGAPDDSADRGRVYIFSEEGEEVVTGVPFLGESSGAEFGWSIADVGDVNGDGIADFLVGAPARSGGDGHAYLYSGKSLRLLRRFTAENAGDEFGYALAGAGDANGDGIQDIIIGAPGYDEARGRAYVFYTPCATDLNGDGTVDGADLSTLLGMWGPCAHPAPAPCEGDLNGDGVTDGADMAMLLGMWGECPAGGGGESQGAGDGAGGPASMVDPVAAPGAAGTAQADAGGVPWLIADLGFGSVPEYLEWLRTLTQSELFAHIAHLMEMIDAHGG